jgi:pimeloyl-ACP methyl ester carboxylesterase
LIVASIALVADPAIASVDQPVDGDGREPRSANRRRPLMSRDYDPTLEPDIEFYRVTDEELTGEPGDLIRSERLAQDAYAALDEASATYRVLYQSASGLGDKNAEPTNEAIAVSGLIAFPPGTAPKGGWPVVSWAHGTVGSADHAAPSMDPYVDAVPGRTGLGLLRKINKAPHALLNAFLRAGWAVAMTDYEGLGTYGNHPYLLGVPEGRGILDIVPAVHQLAAQTVRQLIAGRYAIVGHSQGGQAALWGAHLASTGAYPTRGTLIGVAALAPASNLKPGLFAAYNLPSTELLGDLGAFYPLFCNGVFGGDPTIKEELIFQQAAVTKYREDFNTKSRAELSEDPFWMERPPLAAPNPLWSTDRSAGIFRTQVGSDAQTTAWNKYWVQVDAFNPALKITVPIRISQAGGDTRVNPSNTATLLEQLREIDGIAPVTEKFYVMGEVATPDPDTLGEHFGLLVYELEIQAILGWFADL